MSETGPASLSKRGTFPDRAPRILATGSGQAGETLYRADGERLRCPRVFQLVRSVAMAQQMKALEFIRE